MRTLTLTGLLLALHFLAFASQGTTSIPEWEGMDSLDRDYRSNVACRFQPTISAQGEILYPKPEKVKQLKDSVPKATLRDALLINCKQCERELDGIVKTFGNQRVESLCVLKDCETEKGRKVAVNHRLLGNALNDNRLGVDGYYCRLPESQHHDKNKVSNWRALYSRPNDDTFQNMGGPGGKGLPYEIALIHCGLTATKSVVDGLTQMALQFNWRAEMTTGRHVEAADFFVLRESRSGIDGENNVAAQPGQPYALPPAGNVKKKNERRADIIVAYPPGVTADSSEEGKIGSVIHADLNLGTITRNGTYSGALEIRSKQSLGLPVRSLAGANQFAGADSAPKDGVFERAAYEVEYNNGKILLTKLICDRRGDPHKLVDSTEKIVDPEKPEHQHYVRQPPTAPCLPETVGNGTSPDRDTVAAQLGRKVAVLVKKAGCLDCHGEGNKEIMRFCADGRVLKPKEDGPRILDMITKENPKRKDGGDYRTGMLLSIEELKKLDPNAEVIKQWVDAN